MYVQVRSHAGRHERRLHIRQSQRNRMRLRQLEGIASAVMQTTLSVNRVGTRAEPLY